MVTMLYDLPVQYNASLGCLKIETLTKSSFTVLHRTAPSWGR